MEPTGSRCSIQPSIVFLMITLIVTAAATAMLCVSIMTEHWEYVTWDKEKLRSIEKDVITNSSSGIKIYELEWLLGGQVARVVLDRKNAKKRNVIEEIIGLDNDNAVLPALFFVPTRGGVWNYCITLNENQQQHLSDLGFPRVLCTNYLKLDATRAGGLRTDWQHRMQNLSISCALVCLIILGSSALIGAFGVSKHQISAVLVTGVMYLLAATFAIFSLTIINFKRAQSKSDCYSGSTSKELRAEGVVVSISALQRPYSLKTVSKYFNARIFSAGWSLHLGWGGAGMCILVSILWILLSKIMRYNPMNSLLTVF